MAGTYLDWAATAPLHPAAADALVDGANRLARGEWANPSSVHAPGRAARRALEGARERLAAAFRLPAESLILTSGGTEALGLALRGAEASRLIVGATEHAAVREQARDPTVLPVTRQGLIDMDALDAALAYGPGALVAVQHANNETGVIQPMATICERVWAAGGRVLADCVQSAGKLPLPLADFVALSGHKLGGPAGVGALAVRCKDGFSGVQRGGGQEGGWRGGTENLLGVLGWAAAVESLPAGWTDRARGLQERLEAGVVAAGGGINAAGADRLPTISSVHLPGVAASTQLMMLDLKRVAVSQGAACSSGTLKASATLEAMGLTVEARESLRVSFGWATTEADIHAFLGAWAAIPRKRAA